MKVYLVWQGEFYDSPSVVGIYDNKVAADQHATAIHNPDLVEPDGTVEEFDVSSEYAPDPTHSTRGRES